MKDEQQQNGLEDILNDLYGEGNDETEVQQEPEGNEKTEDNEESTAKSDAEMTDDELSLSVNVDLTETDDETGDTAPASEEKTEEKPETKKPRTAEEIQRIRAEAEADILELRQAFPELRNLKGLGELKDPTKYLDYKKKGLTATEAYTLAFAAGRTNNIAGVTKPKLNGSPTGGGAPGAILSSREMAEARAMGLSDEDIRKYYKKF